MADLLLGRVAPKTQKSVGLNLRDALLVAVNDDKRQMGAFEFARQRLAHAPVAANDDMFTQMIHEATRAHTLVGAAKFSFRHGFGDAAERNHNARPTASNHQHRPDSLGNGVNGLHFAVTDAKNRNHHHIKRVGGRPTERQITQSRAKNDGAKQNQRRNYKTKSAIKIAKPIAQIVPIVGRKSAMRAFLGHFFENLELGRENLGGKSQNTTKSRSGLPS